VSGETPPPTSGGEGQSASSGETSLTEAAAEALTAETLAEVPVEVPLVEPVGVVNVANVLTVLRICLVPVFVVCLVAGGTGWRLAALAAFGGASLTDFLDGQLARKRGLVTDFGKIADPIADKALIGAALITLSAIGELPGWVTGLILAREVGITALRFAVIRRGVIAASQGGKLKTLLQIIAICLYVLPWSNGVLAVIREVVMAAALVVTLVTGVDYVIRAVRMSRLSSGGLRMADGVAGAAGAAARELATEIIGLLAEAGQTVATAESLTGGLVAAALTDVPGSSRAFRGGVVAYATELKATLLGVDAGLLAAHGPVYAPVAAAMAQGVRQRLAATIGVATTGVAGPDPQGGHPPGTVHIAVSLDDDTVVRTIALPGDRDEVRRLTVERVLGLLLGRLREECP
jgi:CDP-diacylglycerol--glycerol-3-phosphate 3-phosphatidyltransferase